MRTFAVLGFLAMAACAPAGGAAAMNDSAAMSTGQFAVDSEKQLPACDSSKEGYLAYVRDEERVLECSESSWAGQPESN